MSLNDVGKLPSIKFKIELADVLGLTIIFPGIVVKT